MTAPRYLAIAWMLALLAQPAVAENLIQNPNFDTDIPPWYNFLETNGTSVWDPFDVDGSGESGSGLVTNFAPDEKVTGAGLAQWVQVIQGGQEYVFDSRVFIPSGQERTADVIIELNFYRVITETGCASFVSPNNADHHSGASDVWEELRLVITAPADAVCAHLFMATYKDQAGGEFQAYLDAARLMPAGIFADGFESGDLESWSSHNP